MPDMFTEFEAIRDTALSCVSTDEGMNLLLDRWESLLSPEQMESAKAIDYGADIDVLSDWFNNVLEEEPGLTGAEALCFTLCPDAENPSIIGLRLSASDCFIVESDGFFEDIIFSDSFIPEKCKAKSGVLPLLSNLTAECASEYARELIPFGYAALAASEITRRSFLSRMVQDGKELHMVAVHMSGYPLVLGSISEEGEIPSLPGGERQRCLLG